MGRRDIRGPADPPRGDVGPCGSEAGPDPPHHPVPGAASIAALPVSRQPLPRRAPPAVAGRGRRACADAWGVAGGGTSVRQRRAVGTCRWPLPGVAAGAEGSRHSADSARN